MARFLRWINIRSLISYVKSVPTCVYKSCMQSGHQNPGMSSQALMSAEGIKANLNAGECLQPMSSRIFSSIRRSSENIEFFAYL